MKKLLKYVLSLCLLACTAQAADVVVKASVPGRSNSMYKQQCRQKAQRLAVEKWLKGYDKDIGADYVKKAVTSYRKYATEVVEPDPSDWESEDGELSGEFTVTVDEESLLRDLAAAGYKVMGTAATANGASGDGVNYEIVIVEMPQGDGLRLFWDAMAKKMSSTSDGQFGFLMRYGEFQLQVREAITKELNRMGYQVPQLEDNPNYKDLKKKDKHVMGYYYDPEKKSFAYTDEFIDRIRVTNPDSLVLYYRLVTLAYDVQKNQIRVRVSLDIRNLAEGKILSQSLGSQVGVSPTIHNLTLDIFSDTMAETVSRTVKALLSGEEMNDKLRATVRALRAQDAAPQGPMKIVVDGTKIDKKIRDDFLLDLEDELKNAGLTKNVKARGNTLTCTVTSDDPQMKDPRRLWRKLKKVLEKAGLPEDEINDDIKVINGDTITITPGGQGSSN